MKIIRKCAGAESENPCDAAFKLLECYLTNKTVKNVLSKNELW
jgi:hypothetical protein